MCPLTRCDHGTEVCLWLLLGNVFSGRRSENKGHAQISMGNRSSRRKTQLPFVYKSGQGMMVSTSAPHDTSLCEEGFASKRREVVPHPFILEEAIHHLHVSGTEQNRHDSRHMLIAKMCAPT